MSDLNVNPFFDGAGAAGVNMGGHNTGGDGPRAATAAPRRPYHQTDDPVQRRRGGGVMVPEGRPIHQGGGQVGRDANDLNGVKLCIDPHIVGQATELDLGQIQSNKQAFTSRVEAAAARAAASTQELVNQGVLTNPIATQRWRASATCHNLFNDNPNLAAPDETHPGLDQPITAAKMTEMEKTGRSPDILNAQPQAVAQPIVEKPVNPQQQATPPATSPEQPAMPQRVKPLEMFGAPPAPPQQSQPAATRAAEASQPAVQKPSVQVVVESPVQGETTASYHGVVEGNGCLVLVYDTRYTDGVMWFPKVQEDQIAVYVPSTKRIFLAETTGLQYTFNGWRHYILSVVEAKDVPEGD